MSVESENLLAFTSHCKYGVRFIGQGVISGKGLATSTLTGMGPEAYVAILTDGNPIAISNTQNGSVLACDPDAHIAHIGADPGVKLDVNFQPSERKSGLDISIDGRRTGDRPTTQSSVGLGQSMGDVGNILNSVGSMLGGGNNR